MKMLTLTGSPREMGRAFGESERDAIREFFALRVANAIMQAAKYGGQEVAPGGVLDVARRCVAPTRAYDPAGFEELSGIAEGAGLSVEEILALNGLTDIRDVLSWPGQLDAFGGCTSFIAQRDVTADGQVLVGQTWDLASDNMPFVLGVHRVPADGPETWCLTTAGCLSLIGMNDAGVAIGTTNVRTTDARPGVTYLSIIHKALSARDLDDAVRAVTEAPRAGGHYYYMADGGGRAFAIECSARSHAVTEVTRGYFNHTNHCKVPGNVVVEGAAPSSTSLQRLGRIDALVAGGAGAFDVARARAALSDDANGSDAILRVDYDGISTNGAVVMAPERGHIEACHGLPHQSPWFDLKALAADPAVAPLA
ncbi:MAG: hypothetical protein EP329_15200 [Deltaproteobacteria bacterium]|nr:MAG: hypothetical protein EP329_15200 [Deltaproteobacteria bacterium]